MQWHRALGTGLATLAVGAIGLSAAPPVAMAAAADNTPVIAAVGEQTVVSGTTTLDLVANTAKVLISGTAKAFATVIAAVENGTQACTAVADVLGRWSCQLVVSAFPGVGVGPTITTVIAKVVVAGLAYVSEKVVVAVTGWIKALTPKGVGVPTVTKVAGVKVSAGAAIVTKKTTTAFKVVGKGTYGNTVTVALRTDPSTKCTGKVGLAGNWSCTIPAKAFAAVPGVHTATVLSVSAVLKDKSAAGSDVTVWVTDDTFKVATPVITHIASTAVTSSKVTFDLATDQATVPVSGTATPEAQVTVTTRTGTCTAAANLQGLWSCQLPAAAFPAVDAKYTSTTVNVKATLLTKSAKGKAVTAKVQLKTAVTAQAPGIRTIQGQAPVEGVVRLTVAEGGEALTLTGQGTPGLVVTITSAGTKACSATVSVEGTYSCVLPAKTFPGSTSGTSYALVPTSVNDGQTLTGDGVELVLTSEPATVVSPQITRIGTDVQIRADAVNDLSVNVATNQISGTGEPGQKITVLREGFDAVGSKIAEGSLAAVKCTATVKADGTWTCQVTGDIFAAAKAALLALADRPVVWLNVRVTVEGKDYDGVRIGVRLAAPPVVADADAEAQAPAAEKKLTWWDQVLAPVAIDFSDSGAVRTLAADQAPGSFALSKDTDPVKSGWIAPSAGLLAMDNDGDGRITSADELFGGLVGQGFADLAKLDTNRDGVVDARDPAWAKLSIWRDVNSDKITDSGELIPISETGIVSLSVTYTSIPVAHADGSMVIEHSTATLSNGAPAAMENLYFTVVE